MEKSIPITFEKVSDVVDSRFTKTKIWIAHTGENRNKSIFTKSVLEQMANTLANVPILGFIETRKDKDDFAGHEERLVIENGEVSLKYVGRAYGVIPAEHNARFEKRFGDDNMEREYLVCDGLIWNKFPEVGQIFTRDEGVKSQSMELHPSSIDGYHDDDGLFVFTQAAFDGACILGEGVTPAMVSSTIEKFSTSEGAGWKEMKAEFDKHFTSIGGESMENNEVVEEVKENEESTEVVESTETEEKVEVEEGSEETKFENSVTEEEESQTTEEVVEEPTKEEVKEEAGEEKEETVEEPITEETSTEDTTEFTEESEEKEEAVKEEEKPEEEAPSEEVKEEAPAEFAYFNQGFEQLSNNDVLGLLIGAVEADNRFERFSVITDVFETQAIVHQRRHNRFFRLNYSIDSANYISLGDYEEVFVRYLTAPQRNLADMIGRVFTTQEQFTAHMEEVKALKEFKAEMETEEKEAKLAEYSSFLSKDEQESIKTKFSTSSIEDIEKEIAFLLLKKNQFSVESSATGTKVKTTNSVKANPYGEASIYFSKIN